MYVRRPPRQRCGARAGFPSRQGLTCTNECTSAYNSIIDTLMEIINMNHLAEAEIFIWRRLSKLVLTTFLFIHFAWIDKFCLKWSCCVADGTAPPCHPRASPALCRPMWTQQQQAWRNTRDNQFLVEFYEVGWNYYLLPYILTQCQLVYCITIKRHSYD